MCTVPKSRLHGKKTSHGNGNAQKIVAVVDQNRKFLILRNAAFESPALFAGSWVSLFVGAFEPCGADVRVDLSRHQRLVS